jgi:hypothetical protein
MRNDTVRNTQARDPRDDRARRRMLGFVVLVLTLGAGYLVAHRGVGGTIAMALAEDAEMEEAAPAQPTLAEIMAQIDEVASRHQVSPRLVAAVISVESEFNPRAVSRRGAQGLMQLMPATAATLDVQDTFDTRENIEGGVRHLRVLMDRYHNDLPLVLAAYNAGDRAVLAYRGVPPYRETRQYVIRVLRRFDRDAARAAAVRIYGARPAGRPVVRPAAVVRTQLPVIHVSTAAVVEPPAIAESQPPRAPEARIPRAPDPPRIPPGLQGP